MIGRLSESSALRLLVAFFIATIGGTLFWGLGMPAPWLSGSMTAVVIAVMSGMQFSFPDRLRDAVFLFLGLSMGSGITPEALATISVWPLSVLLLAVSIPIIVVAGWLYMAKIAHWPQTEAVLASVPGALSFLLATAIDRGINTSRIAISQSLRVFMLVAFLPIFITSIGDTPKAPAPSTDLINPVLFLGLLVLSGLAGFLLNRLRVPGGYMFGGLIVGGFLYGSGTITAVPSELIVIAGLITLGVLIGCRFSSSDFRQTLAILRHSLISFLIAALIATGFASLASWLLDLPIGQVMLAFAPGGLEAMTIMAFTLNLDPAYVAAHHALRFIGIAFTLPLLMAWLGRKRKIPGQNPVRESRS